MIEFDEYRERAHEIINDINEACNSAIAQGFVFGVTVDDLLAALAKIEQLAVYPEERIDAS